MLRNNNAAERCAALLFIHYSRIGGDARRGRDASRGELTMDAPPPRGLGLGYYRCLFAAKTVSQEKAASISIIIVPSRIGTRE